MSLLFMDGFDGTNDVAEMAGKWDVAPYSSSAPGRTGPYCAMQYGGYAAYKFLPPGDVFIVGYALRFGVFPNQEQMYFQEGSIVHISIGITDTGVITVRRGSTLLASSTTPVAAINSWQYIEAKVVVHASAGSVEVHVDTVPVVMNVSLSSINTKNGGTGNVDRFGFSGSTTYGGSPYPYAAVDDLYICDDNGSTNNNFLGICVVETLLPQTGAGTHQDFTPSSGTDHGAMVDEYPPDEDSTYNGSLTVGHQDSYNYPSLALTGTIIGVQTNLYVRKTDAGVRTVAPIVRLASTTTVGATVTPPTTYRYFPQLWESKPAGGAWTESDINALEVGMKIVG